MIKVKNSYSELQWSSTGLPKGTTEQP